MKVKQLEISGFRGIKQMSFDFQKNQKLAVIVGVNGTGKTSILDCLSILLSKTDYHLYGDKRLQINEPDINNELHFNK